MSGDLVHLQGGLGDDACSAVADGRGVAEVDELVVLTRSSELLSYSMRDYR